MVLFVVRWNLRPEKVEDYAKWAKSTIQRQMAVPGVAEFRAYRAATGAHRFAVTQEFADMAARAAWESHEDIQKTRKELDAFATVTSPN